MSGGRLPGWAKVVVVVVTTLAVIYAVNLGELWLKNRRALAVEANLRAEVARQLAAIERIEAETSRAQTDAYVEEFARNEKGWVQPGDHQVVPLPDDVAVPGEGLPDAAGQPESQEGLLDRLRDALAGD